MKCPDRDESEGFVRPSFSPFHFAEHKLCQKHGLTEHLSMNNGCLQCLDDQQKSEFTAAGDDLVFIYSRLLQAESELKDDLSESSSGRRGLNLDIGLSELELEFEEWCQSDDDLIEAVF